MNDKVSIRGLLQTILLIALIIGGMGLVYMRMFGFYTAGVGEAVILIDPIGKSISDPILGATWGFKPPWVNVASIYYATKSYQGDILCFSSDQLEMKITVMMRWQLDTSKLKSLYQSYPNLDYDKVAIQSIMEKTIRLVTKDFSALETIRQRNAVAQKMQEAIFGDLKSSPLLKDALIGLEFDLKNIAYPTTYTQAIESKLASEQKRIQAEFERERIIIESDATAKGMIIKAEAEAKSKLIISNGTKEAITNIMNAAGVTNSEKIAELYLWVETLKSMNVGTYIIVTGQDGTPMIYNIPPAK